MNTITLIARAPFFALTTRNTQVNNIWQEGKHIVKNQKQHGRVQTWRGLEKKLEN
jgi:hypothetical protein